MAFSTYGLRLANHSAHPYEGWLRTTIHGSPPHESGRIVLDDGTELLYVLAREVAPGVRAIDVRTALAASQSLDLDLALAEPAPFTLGPPPTGLGDLKANGVPMQLVEARPDGAAWTAHCRVWLGYTLDVFLRHYPGEDVAHGECLVTGRPGIIALNWNGVAIAPLGGWSGYLGQLREGQSIWTQLVAEAPTPGLVRWKRPVVAG
jgi:hypothetical protein